MNNKEMCKIKKKTRFHEIAAHMDARTGAQMAKFHTSKNVHMVNKNVVCCTIDAYVCTVYGKNPNLTVHN